ncbi:beta-ketoacyl synthase N-terminal-like domain-containing protein [Desulfoluna sp.]|uniref:beta-ketoacyl synthase N-terminal-like domain-containing protein n=1 Tax=Desulfoluna sp. TaxID=2045199 RepID=UPI00260314E3|nr:beta-ketoacyl synthase N-terminal-like domain-containing protein [Desulfoluna sp.]
MSDPCNIAVTGMACILPGAPDLAAYHDNLTTGYDAITEVPQHRWDPLYYDPESTSSDRFYCRRGGFIDGYATFDPISHGIMPIAAEGAEPDQLLTLKVSCEALRDAGYDVSDLPGRQTGIILGRGNYIGPGMVRLEQHVRTAQQLVSCLESLFPEMSKKAIGEIKAEFQSKLGHYGPDTVIGLVPNLTASRVANRLNLCGPAYTIDAACASSLMAIDQAAKALQHRQCDLMLAGGVHLCHDVSFWSVFTQLGVLSKTGVIRPFDKDADGLLIGEGVGVVVLKRYEDAVADGDKIYAVIKGIGVSSDGKASSLMSPDVGGQTLALERAWKMSGLNPEHIGTLEAHGTGTRAGDLSELQTLAGFFGQTGMGTKPGLGSVKSMIGHCMPAAGVAGFIKTALSLYHKVRFPSLNCDQPDEALDPTGFRLIHQAEPWHSEGLQRIAGVNAFGFGGVNVHLVMSEHDREAEASVSTAPVPAPLEEAAEPLLLISVGSREEVLDALEKGETRLDGGAFRLVVFNPDEKKRDKARKIILRGGAWRGRGDIYYTSEGLVTGGGKTAFLFPGVDSAFEPKLDDVAAFFDKTLPGCLHPENLEETGVGIIRVNQFVHSLLGDLGITPDVVAGHSIGEWSGMIATGVIDSKGLDEFIQNLEAGSLEVPDVAFAAAGCDIRTAESFFDDLEDICVSTDNCSHQVILCGIDASVNAALNAMKKEGILCLKLPFRSGFHSPLYADSLGVHRAKFDALDIGRMKTPLWSATTCGPYPEEREALRALMLDHLVKPVRFRELILTLYEEGVRVFIQAGTGSLTGFVQDILKGKKFAAINTNTPKMSGMRQLRRALAACFIEGLEPDLPGAGMLAEPLSVPSGGTAMEMPLTLGVPLVRLETRLDFSHVGPASSAVLTNSENHPVLAAYEETLNGIVHMHKEVLETWQSLPESQKRCLPAAPVDQDPGARKRTCALDLSLEGYPWLIDHSLFPQSEGCTQLSEKFPVVPMTMSIDILCEYAKKMVPGKKVTAIEKIQAFNWIDLSQPFTAELEADYDGVEYVQMVIKGYFSGRVRLADTYPTPPEPAPFLLRNPQKAPVSCDRLYREGWMFHGPAYQGVKETGTLGDNGIRGVITAAEGQGSLLDNAGQLFGYWVMEMTQTDRLAMPIRIGKIEFYSDNPGDGEEVDCLVKAYPMKPGSASADMELTVGGTLWAGVTGWDDRRFDTDEALFEVMRDAGSNLLSSVDENDFLIYRDVYKTANATQYISRRYCTQAEKALYDRIEPKRKRAWLNTLIVLKDAVRNRLFAEGISPVYPAEISLIGQETIGRCEAVGPSGETYWLMTASEPNYSVASVVPEGTDHIKFKKFF